MSLKALCRGLLAVATLLALTGPLAAQDAPVLSTGGTLFYQEIVKDGRIYVFNSAAEAARFDKTGEVGRAITKIGVGPNGETVVGDSETALELFFFKHGIAEKVDRPKPPKVVISWKDGQTTAEFDKASITFMNRLQLRFTEQLPDDKTKLAGTGAAGDSKPSFRIRRYEPQFQGWIYTKDLTFKLEFAFQDFQNGAVAAGGGINDAYFNYDFTKGKKMLRAQLGQFKVPFGRQEMTSSFNLQLVDRAGVAAEFERGRDQGLQLDGLLFNQKIDWRVGAFNGNGRSFNANDNDKLQYDARVTFQPWGDVKYSEADFESVTGHPLFAIAAQFEQNDYTNAVADPPNVAACPCAVGLKRTVWGADAVFKWRGIYAMAEYFDREIDPAKAGLANFKSNGYNLEAGYLIGGPTKGKWSLAGRYAAWDPSDAVSGNDRTELRLGINWFYNKHFAKIQADWGQLEDKKAGTKDQEIRVQTQLYF
jgi:hypothetical protein